MQRTIGCLVLVLATTAVAAGTACGGSGPDSSEDTSTVAAGKLPQPDTRDAASERAQQSDAASSRDGDGGKDGDEEGEEGEERDGGDGGRGKGKGNGNGNGG